MAKSKNDPTMRRKSKDMIFQGKKVKPIKFLGESGSIIAAEFDDGSVVTDSNGNPISWQSVVAMADNQ
jgi:hypothetical protein